jgi:hypothetical protein
VTPEEEIPEDEEVEEIEPEEDQLKLPTGEPVPNTQRTQPPQGQPPAEPPVQPPSAPAPAPPPPSTPAPAAAPSPVTVALAPGRLTVAGGGGFAFNVMVAGATGLQKLSITLKYDPGVAEFDQGLEGIFMRADGTQTTFAATKAGDGMVNLEIARVGGDKGASGNGSVAAVRFKPVAAGRTLVNIVRAVAEDPQGRPITVNASGADVTVSP